MTENYANFATTTLNGAINNSVTSIVVTSATTFPAPNFTIVIDSEIMSVTAVSGNTLTVTRGIESTVAASHSDQALVANVLTAGVMGKIIANNVQTGPMASIPASQEAGRLYFPTDEPIICYDNGSNFKTAWGGFLANLTLPIESNFGWLRQDTGVTVTNNGGSTVMNCPAPSTTGLRSITPPSPPYTVTACMQANGHSENEYNTYLLLWDASGNKGISVGFTYNIGDGGSMGPLNRGLTWVGGPSITAQTNWQMDQPPYWWYRWVYTTSTMTAYTSTNGIDWGWFNSFTSSYLTTNPSHLAWGGNCNNQPSTIRLLSWKVTTP